MFLWGVWLVKHANCIFQEALKRLGPYAFTLQGFAFLQLLSCGTGFLCCVKPWFSNNCIREHVFFFLNVLFFSNLFSFAPFFALLRSPTLRAGLREGLVEFEKLCSLWPVSSCWAHLNLPCHVWFHAPEQQGRTRSSFHRREIIWLRFTANSAEQQKLCRGRCGLCRTSSLATFGLLQRDKRAAVLKTSSTFGH